MDPVTVRVPSGSPTGTFSPKAPIGQSRKAISTRTRKLARRLDAEGSLVLSSMLHALSPVRQLGLKRVARFRPMNRWKLKSKTSELILK